MTEMSGLSGLPGGYDRMKSNIQTSSFFRAEQAFLTPPEPTYEPERIRRKKQEICKEIENMLSIFAETWCGEITPDTDFSWLIQGASTLADEIEEYARYLDLLDDELRRRGM